MKRVYTRPVADGEVWMEDYGAYVHIVGFGSFIPGNPKWNLSGGRHVEVATCADMPSDFIDPVFGSAWPWVVQTGFPFEGFVGTCDKEVLVRHGDTGNPYEYAVTQAQSIWPNLDSARVDINSYHDTSFRNGSVDLWAIMMHEFGHVTGLGHNNINDGSEPPTYQRSVMFEYYNYGGVRDVTEYEQKFVLCQYYGDCS